MKQINLKQLNSIEFKKLNAILSKLSKLQEVSAIELSVTSNYKINANEYVIKTNKVEEDTYIKVKIKYNESI